MTVFIPAEPQAQPPKGSALLALGFRPFYLLAGAYAALAVPLWGLQYAGWLSGANPLWHAHEMLFGYAFAVIAGFLLTAVRAWTRASDAFRRAARGHCGTVARGAGARVSFSSREQHSRCIVRRRGRLGDRPADCRERQPQLVFHPFRARARRGERGIPGVSADRARRGARRRALGHRDHGRACDPVFHQQRGDGRRRAPQSVDRARRARLDPASHGFRCASAAGLADRARGSAAACGAPGAVGAACDPRPADPLDPAPVLCVGGRAPHAARARRLRSRCREPRDARADDRHDRRPDARHDDAHRARPHCTAAQGRTLGSRGLRAGAPCRRSEGVSAFPVSSRHT